MCEFTVILNGKKVFEDAVYVKVDGGKVILKDILGRTEEVPNCYVEEINVSRERLILRQST